MKRRLLKILLTAVGAALAIALSACVATVPEDPEENTAAPETKKDFMFIEISGVTLRSGVTAEAFLKTLEGAGITPERVDEAESCMFDGKDVTYRFGFGEAFAFPQKSGLPVDQNVVDEIYVTDQSAVAMGGVKVGFTEDQVKEIFGDGSFKDGARLVYNASGSPENKDSEPCIYFYIENGTVTGIGLLANLYHVSA